MGYICLKPKGSCQKCTHFRYNEERGSKVCYAGEDLNIPNGGEIPADEETDTSTRRKKANPTEIVICIKNGMMEAAYSNHKNVTVELLDFDTLREDEIEYNEERIAEIKKNKHYKDVY